MVTTPNLSVDLGGGLRLANPVMTASGTFGYGLEYADFLSLSDLGAIVVKGTTLAPREGNAYPRLAETPAGLLNAVGLQNKGVEHFRQHTYPRLRGLGTNVIVNVAGASPEQYAAVVERLDDLDEVAAVELNISCPNVKQGGMAFGTDPSQAAAVVRAARKACHKHLMVKLTPNVTDVAAIARAVEQEGADSVSLINTLLGMAIDARTRRPKLSTITGGLSGPCVKPVALRMVWQVHQAVGIPVVGLGGIVAATDAVEFLLAGASAVQVGTASFVQPTAAVDVVRGLRRYMEEQGVNDVSELTGALIV